MLKNDRKKRPSNHFQSFENSFWKKLPYLVHRGIRFILRMSTLTRILRNIWCLFYFSHGQSCTWMLYLHEKLSYLIHRDGISWIGTRFIDTNSSKIFSLVLTNHGHECCTKQLWSITKWGLGKRIHLGRSYPYRSIVSNIFYHRSCTDWYWSQRSWLKPYTIIPMTSLPKSSCVGRFAVWHDRMIYCFAHLSNVINYSVSKCIELHDVTFLACRLLYSCIASSVSLHPYPKRNNKLART